MFREKVSISRRELLVVTVGVVAALAVAIYLAVSSFFTANSSPPSRVPPANPTAAYELEIGSEGGVLTRVAIGADGSGCDRLVASERLYTACLVAVNLDARLIGASALGRLNSERTPALDALVWRARLNGDASVCAEGGLSGDFLVECEQLATANEYEVRDSGLVVRVPRAGD
jgi:hypothetical protein